MFDKEREVAIIKLKCGTRSHFLNELFPCCRKLRHANKIYVKKNIQILVSSCGAMKEEE